MFRTGTPTPNFRSLNKSANHVFTRWSAFIIVLSLAALGSLLQAARSSRGQSKSAITVQAAGRGNPYFHFQDGREQQVQFRGERNLSEALRSGLAQPRSMAAIDLDRDGPPDVVTGYAYNGAGLLTIQHGNPDAFAPKDESVYARLQQGYNPESLLPTADVYKVPVPVDYLQLGDFNHDNQRDVLLASTSGQMFLLPGDGRGGLRAPEQIALPGVITSLTSGEFRAPDGWTDVAVGIVGPYGPELLVYDGTTGIEGEAMHLSLPAPAIAVEFGEVDGSPFQGLAAATGSQIEIVHGWGRKQSPEPTLPSRVELIDAGANVRGVAIGFFVWSREGTAQIATFGEDGTVRVLTRGALSTQAFSDAEITARAARARQNLRKSNVDVEKLVGWHRASTEQWSTAREVVTGNVVGAGATAQNLFQRTHISFVGTEDLLVLNANQQKLEIVRQVDATAGPQTNTLKAAGDMVTISLSASAAPVAVLALPQKLNGERSLLVMHAGSAAATVIPMAPTATITVDRFDDPNGGSLAAASACGVGANDCSLRGAVQFANANAGTTISIPAGTVVLATTGSSGCTSGGESNVNGDLEINPSTTLTGAGSASTIIRQAAATNDRVICLDVPLAANTYIFSGMTITGGRDAGINGGAGLLGGAKNAVTNFTDVTFANNQTSNASFGGGGITVTGGNMTVTNCTFGAANPPGANRNDLTLANASFTSGGGIAYTSGDPAGTSGAVGTLTVTGTTFTHNTASGIGGGGLDVFGLNLSTPTVNVSTTTFTSNQGVAANTSGGGMINEAANVTLATTSFTSNSVLNRGGGLYVGGGTTLLDGTNPSLTFASNNTAPNNPSSSSISTASALNVSGTNTTIGGSIEISAGGIWTTNTGTNVNPTDILIAGGTMNCNNSTMNITGNLTLGPSGNGIFGGTFNGNTGTVNLSGNLTTNTGGTTPAPSFTGGTNFNFVGSGAQSSGGTLSPTFVNLTVNKSNTLTLGVNSSVTGNLTLTAGTFDLGAFTVNRSAAGGTLAVSNGTVLKVGGTNPLPTNYNTHSIGATSTIEYSGTSQTVSTLNSAQIYGNLTISGSGSKTLQGATTVAGNLLISGGTLDVSASNFALNVAGNFTNNVAAANFNPRAGIVTFNGGAAQNLNGSSPGAAFNNFVVNKTGALTVGGSTTALTISGAVTLTAGTFAAGSAATIGVSGGDWTNNGGTFTPGSSVVSFTNTAAAQNINGSAATQTFNAITVAKTAQTLAIGGSTTTLNLNGSLLLTSGTFSAATAVSINVGGDWTNNGGTFTPGTGLVTFNGGAAQNLNGSAATQPFNNFTVNKVGGTLTVGGSTTSLNIGANVTLAAGTFAAGTATAISLPIGNWTNNGGVFTPAASTVTFSSAAGNQAINGTSVSQTFNSITMNKPAQVLNVSGSTTTVTLNGSMTITAGAINPATMNVAGDWTNNFAILTPITGTVVFNGAGAQNLNGTTTTQTFNNLTVSKSGGTLTGGGSTTTLNLNGNFSITGGTFAAGTLSAINVIGGWTNNGGTFTPGAGTVNFNGGVGQTVGGSAATTFNNLTNSNANGLSMANDNTVNAVLALTAGNITVANTKTLSLASATASTGTFDAVGSVKRTNTSAAATTYTFGNPNNQITFTAAGTRPADITVNLVKAAPSGGIGFPNAVSRTYTITPTGGSGFSATVQLHYLASELNGNTEGAGLNLWRFNGTGWAPIGQTANSTAAPNNWVSKAGVTAFSAWTFNSTLSPTAVNGSISGRITTSDGKPVEGAVIRLIGGQSRKLITDRNGNYRFENVETGAFYTVTPARANYKFSPHNRSFSQVGNQTEAVFSAEPIGDVANPLDTAEYFVRQQYADVLSREPDEVGFNYWSDQILACAEELSCLSTRRREVAAAFFMAAENQATGSYTYDVYAGALGRRPAFNEFSVDRHQVVGGANLDAAKTVFVQKFVQRAEFMTKYEGALTAESFVDALIQSVQTAGVDLSSERANLIGIYNLGGDLVGSRGAVVRTIADNATFKQSQYNRAFVLTEYFSYLQREVDQSGYDFWVGVLNTGDPGNYRGMVCSFVTSAEYQNRFSSVVSHNNRECSGQ